MSSTAQRSTGRVKSCVESGPESTQKVLPGRTGDYLQHRSNNETGIEIRLHQQSNKISASKSGQQDKRPRTRLPSAGLRARAEMEPLGPQAVEWNVAQR